MPRDRPARRVRVERELSTGAFGASVSVRLLPEVAAYTARAADDRVWTQHVALSGSVAVTSGEAVLSTGTTQYAYMTIQTVAQSAYRPGTGMRCQWTTRFPDGDVDDAFQAAGPFHGEAGFAVGYPGDGSGFGLMFRRGRRFEVQALTVTVPAAGSETVTITLNGTAQSAVAVTAGTVQHNAKEIAEAVSYSDSGGLVPYDVWAIDDTVYYLRQASGAAAGAFTISSTGDCDGTYSQFQAGAAGTETWIAQADWDDPCDGGGRSGVVVDPQYGQIWILTYGWLGYLGAQLWVPDRERQEYWPVHYIPWVGTTDATSPTVADPRFPILYAVASLGSVVDVSIAGASCMIAAEDGSGVQLGPILTAESRDAAVGTTETPILAIMCSPVDLRNQVINRRRITIEQHNVANVGAKDATIRVYIGTQANLVGSVFESTDLDEIMLTDTAATAITGTLDLVEILPIEGSGSHRAGIHAEPFALYRGQVLIITGQTTSSTTEIVVSIVAHEDP